MDNNIREALGKKVALKACSICGNQEYIVVDHLLTAQIVNDDNSISLGSEFQFATLVCDNCGYMLNFHAGTLGVKKIEKEDL